MNRHLSLLILQFDPCQPGGIITPGIILSEVAAPAFRPEKGGPELHFGNKGDTPGLLRQPPFMWIIGLEFGHKVLVYKLNKCQ